MIFPKNLSRKFSDIVEHVGEHFFYDLVKLQSNIYIMHNNNNDNA